MGDTLIKKDMALLPGSMKYLVVHVQQVATLTRQATQKILIVKIVRVADTLVRLPFDARSATLTLVEEIKNTTTNVNKRVIKTEFIADIKVISRSSESEPGKLVMPKQEVCAERLKRALAQAQKSEKMLGTGVSAHAQALMDHLAKM